MKVIDLKALDLKNKRVLIREDLNVPMRDGRITSDARIRAAIPTIEYVLAAGAKLMLMSHLGRPKEGVSIDDQPEASMQIIASHIGSLLGKSVKLQTAYLDGFEFGDEDLVLFENIRINQGEKSNDETLSKKLASLCDIFVMDAFGTAHRAHASTEGVARFAPIACAGPLLMSELSALTQSLNAPVKPVVAIVGGSKVSTKLEVLKELSHKVDHLIVGGGIANTFLAATGKEVGRSLCERALLDSARSIMANVDVPMPIDVVVSKAFDKPELAQIKLVSDIDEDDMILDLGPKSLTSILSVVSLAKTIIWNGPLGVFEEDAFANGTKALTAGIAENKGFSIAGGGDTLAAIDKYDAADDISYISTGGGAFLEFVEGKQLPAVVVLEARAANT